MIRKPPEGWGRESAAVSTVRTVAATGTAAVQTGGRMLRNLWLCGMGAMMAFGALGSLATGSMPGFIGGGLVSAVMIGFGMRSFKPRGARDAEAPAIIGGTGVDYSRGKLAGYCLFGVLAVAAAFWGAGHAGGVWRLASFVMIPVFGGMIFGAARKIAGGDLTALRWDARGLTAAGLWTRRSGSWAEVVSIGVREVNTYAAYGLIKTGSSRSLAIRFASGKVHLSAGMLDLQGRTLEGLVLTLQAAQMGRGAPAAAAPRQPQHEPLPASRAAGHTVDPEAAIARYKEEQARALAAAQPAPQPVMGYYAASGPARATFGRRAG